MKMKSFITYCPFVLVLVAFSALAGNQALRIHSMNKVIDALQDTRTEMYHEVQVEKTKHESLAQTIRSLSDKNTSLAGIIQELKHTSPTEIQYVTRTQTVIKAAEPMMTFRTPPEHYTHFLDGDIPVARFDTTDNGYRFKTYDLTFRSTLVIGKRDNAVLVQVSSSADDKWHEVKSELTVVDPKIDYPNIQPTLHVGIGLDSASWRPEGVVAVPIIQATDWLDFAAPGIGISSVPSADFYIVGVNVAKPLPVVDDIWLWAGPSIDTEAQAGISIALTTQF